MGDLNTAKNIAIIIFSTALSFPFSVFFTLSTFSYISDFRYVPQYYNMPRDMALLFTALYVLLLISFIYKLIDAAVYFMSLPNAQRSTIVNFAKSGWVKTCRNEPLSPEEELFSGIVGYSIAYILSLLLDAALPAITAFALPSIISLDHDLIVASLSVISVVAALTVAVNVYCGLKLSVLKKEVEKPHVLSPENPLNDPVESDKLLDNSYLVGTEASQSVGSGKIAATFT